MTSLSAIQNAVYNKLTGDVTLMAMVSGVFDAVSDSQSFPYITLGEATEIPFNTFSRDGRESTLTMHIWSQYAGFKEALDILDRMNTLLDDASLTITGFNHVLIAYENAETIRDPDGQTRHIPVRYRVVVQK